MVGDKSTFDRVIKPVVLRDARWRFRNDPDRETKIADALSVAWEIFQAAQEKAFASVVSRFAIGRVVTGRQFRQTVRSLDGPQRRAGTKAQRMDFDVSDVSRTGDDPADLAALRIDFLEWFSTELSTREQAICRAFLMGERTSDVAKQFGLSKTRISQFRREFVGRWQAFTA